MALRIVLTGGGTGGHVYPVLAVAQEIKKQIPNSNFLWIGSKNGLESKIAVQADLAYKAVPTGKMRRYFSLQNIVDIFKVPFGILKAYFLLMQFRPQVVFSKGGYVSYPVVFAAWLRDIPILLHESDSVPGLANRRLASKATLIATSFPIVPQELPKSKTVYTGLPIREQLLHGDAEKARTAFKLDQNRPVLLILGGSQGAQKINQIIQTVILDLLPHFQIIHQVGDNNQEELKEFAEKHYERGYRMVGFIEEGLEDVYALADLVVSRAGGIIHELAALGKVAILLPLASAANDHQAQNAYTLEKQSAATVVEDENLTPEVFKSELFKLFYDSNLQQEHAKQIKIFAEPMSAKKIAYWIARLVEIR